MELTKARKSRILTDYGTILKYGSGKEVPTNIKEEMKLKHGFDEQCMDHLEKEARAEQKVFIEKKETKRIGDIVAMLKKKQ